MMRVSRLSEDTWVKLLMLSLFPFFSLGPSSEPVVVTPELNPAPPFESPTIDEILRHYVRYAYSGAKNPAPEPVKEAGRKACALVMKMIDSPGFYAALTAALEADKSVNHVLFRPFLERWRAFCHQCPAEMGERMCAVCRARPEPITPVYVSHSFGQQFLSHVWDSIKQIANGKDVFASSRVPQEIRASIPGVLAGLERELAYASTSVIFHKHGTVRLALLSALASHASFVSPVVTVRLPATQGPTPPTLASQPARQVTSQQSRSQDLSNLIKALTPQTKKLKGDAAKEAVEKKEAFVVKVVTDSKNPEGWELLIGLKEVISKQLPEMPKYYIMRALFDGYHESLCVIKDGEVVGGCTFRPFLKQEFVEVVFLVVNPNTLNKGLGSLIMGEVKNYVHSALGVEYLLTYADNTAIDFFKKQGFTRDISLSRNKWMGYIKDYTKATLMEFHIEPPRDAGIAQQAQWVKLCINANLAATPVQEGLPRKTTFPIKAKNVPGVESDSHLQSRMMRILQRIKRSRFIGPFLKPVDPNEAPRYTEIVKNPMSIQDIEKRLEAGEYQEMQTFEKDLRQIVINCQLYNDPTTWYYKWSEKIDEMITKLV